MSTEVNLVKPSSDIISNDPAELAADGDKDNLSGSINENGHSDLDSSFHKQKTIIKTKSTNEDEEPDNISADEEEKVGSLEVSKVIEGKRERKKTQRLSETFDKLHKAHEDKRARLIEENSSTIKAGKGMPIGEIPYIDSSLRKAKTNDLKLLHSCIFGRPGVAHEIRSNIRKFRGFNFDKKSPEFEKKVNIMSQRNSAELRDTIRILGLEVTGSREVQSERILEFLLKPDVKHLSVRSKLKKRKTKTKKTTKTNKQTTGESDSESDAGSDLSSEDAKAPTKKVNVTPAKSSGKKVTTSTKKTTVTPSKKTKISDEDDNSEDESAKKPSKKKELPQKRLKVAKPNVVSSDDDNHSSADEADQTSGESSGSDYTEKKPKKKNGAMLKKKPVIKAKKVVTKKKRKGDSDNSDIEDTSDSGVADKTKKKKFTTQAKNIGAGKKTSVESDISDEENDSGADEKKSAKVKKAMVVKKSDEENDSEVDDKKKSSAKVKKTIVKKKSAVESDVSDEENGFKAEQKKPVAKAKKTIIGKKSAVESDEENDSEADEKKKTVAKAKKAATNKKREIESDASENENDVDTTATVAKKAKLSPSADSDSDADAPLAVLKKSIVVKPPTDDELKQKVIELLAGVNMDTTSLRVVRDKVFSYYPGVDLQNKKEFVNTVVKEFIANS